MPVFVSMEYSKNKFPIYLERIIVWHVETSHATSLQNKNPDEHFLKRGTYFQRIPMQKCLNVDLYVRYHEVRTFHPAHAHLSDDIVLTGYKYHESPGHQSKQFHGF